jgi:pSer/pThr/pTyr-binding forkhead associated (FHA) protein
VTADRPYLVDQAGRRFPLAAPVTRLGRSPKSDVYVADQRASRRHAEIRWDGEGSTLHDLESTNGTRLNGAPITSPQPLLDGDKITVADAVFTFRDPEATLRVDPLPLLAVDAASGQIWVNHAPVSLSPKEQALFDLLYTNAKKVCSKQEIATAVWPEYQSPVQDYQIESLVKRLREKIEPDPRDPKLITTLRGRGYRLAA